MDELLQRLKGYIKEKGLTIYKLTELSDLSENTIYNWYNKGAEPSIRALSSICKILNISMAELFSETNNENLTIRESELLKRFRNLTETQKDVLIKLLDEFKS